jgi:ApaG protein
VIIKETQGISVSVKSKYREKMSDPVRRHFFFSYEVTVTNQSEQPVQLLSRHWDIFDTNWEFREVEGPGVIGLQPVIQPGQSFTYESGCNFVSRIGQMKGFYIMRRMLDNSTLIVDIPAFTMMTPELMN